MQRRTFLTSTAALAAAAAGLSACGKSGSKGSSATEADPKAPVTITVGGKPTADQAANLKQFNTQVAQFTKQYPNVTLKTTEYTWDPQTFQAQLAGGTLPTVVDVPFTDIQALIQRGQVADITDWLAKDSVLSTLSPTTAKIAQADGRSYGVVVAAYTMAVHYNRMLYKAAGLDPDKGPGSWDELYSNAVAVAKKSGKAGFEIGTTGNIGGWMATTMSYAFGSLVQTADGDSAKATLTTPGMTKALQFLQKMRFTGDAYGKNLLLGNDDSIRAFAATQAGHTINGGDLYGRAVGNFGMAPTAYGIAPMPQATGGLGVLGGGSVEGINPKADANQTLAALNWIKFHYLNKFVDQTFAVTDAKSNLADKLPVGLPSLPVFNDAAQAKYMSWIKPYINVPQSAFTDYVASFTTLKVVPEPSKAAQQTYATLDPVVQAVLSKKGTDISGLLTKAQTTAQSQIESAG